MFGYTTVSNQSIILVGDSALSNRVHAKTTPHGVQMVSTQ